MKIVVTPTGGGTAVTLADHGTESVRAFQVVPRREVQPSLPIRATYGRLLMRGGLLHTVGFEVTKQHASVHAAQKFCLEHAAALPQSVTCVWTLADTTTTKTMAAAELAVTSITHLGIATFAVYRITGGQIT